jgi:L-fuconolactonase
VLPLADAHLHLFRGGYAGAYGRSPAGTGDEADVYETFRRVHHIVAGLVVGYEDGEIDPANNAYVRRLAQTRDWMTTVAFVRSGLPPDQRHLAGLLAAGHRGIALYLNDAAAAESVAGWAPDLWALLSDQGAIVSLNVATGVLAALAPLIRRYQGCSFLVSHLGEPGSFRRAPSAADAERRLEPLLSLSALSNVYVKISGLYAVSDPPHDFPHPQATPFVRLLLDSFGPLRCLWGSDFSPCLDHVSFAQVADPVQLAGLPEPDYARVMGGNLMDLLGRQGDSAASES